MPHPMGFAAPGCVEHWLSIHLCLVGQRQPGHTYYISFHTFRQCLSGPCMLSSVPGIGKFVINLIQGVARCTWPYHLSHWQWRVDAISSMPSFCSSEAVGVSSLFSMPQIQRIMVGHCGGAAAVQVYLVIIAWYSAMIWSKAIVYQCVLKTDMTYSSTT